MMKKSRYTSEVAAWLPISLDGSQYGADDINAGNGADGPSDDDDSPICDFAILRQLESLEKLADATWLPVMCRVIQSSPPLIDKLDDIFDACNDGNKGYDKVFFLL